MDHDFEKLWGFVFAMWMLFVAVYCIAAAIQGVALWLTASAS